MPELAPFLTGKALETLLGQLHALIAVVRRDGTLVSWNPAFEKARPSIRENSRLLECAAEADRDELLKKLASTAPQQWFMDVLTGAEDEAVHCDCRLTPLDSQHSLFLADRIEADATLAEIVQRLNKQVRLFQVERDIANKLAHRKHTEVEAVMAQAHEISHIDSLTFLPNRRMMVRELQDEVLRAQRYQTQFSISFVDVDHFKRINDSHGHLTGDEVLRQLGMKIREQIRHPDIAGRYGGEEFLILLPNSGSSAAAEQASRLCRVVREMVMHIRDLDLKVTISIGIAEFEPGVDTWESLLNRADSALYEAKSSGRDRWAVAD